MFVFTKHFDIILWTPCMCLTGLVKMYNAPNSLETFAHYTTYSFQNAGLVCVILLPHICSEYFRSSDNLSFISWNYKPPVPHQLIKQWPLCWGNDYFNI